MIVGLEALIKFVPPVFIDSVGHAFIYPLVKLSGSKVVAYVHYPTISSDMLAKVKSKSSDFNNDPSISSSQLKSNIKILYYDFFAILYKIVGSFTDQVMVNSTWTFNHINRMWNLPTRTRIVYPPCDTEKLLKFSTSTRRELIVLSIAQYRPEKGHALQIKSFKKLQSLGDFKNVMLVCIGSSRNQDDVDRAKALVDLSIELGIEKQVSILENVSYPNLLEYLSKSLIGIHSMKDEHFGIGIIEFMAAGLVPIVHDSGGPRSDIVADYNGQKVGFHCVSEDDYANALCRVLEMNSKERDEMRIAARSLVRSKFNVEHFNDEFTQVVLKVLDM